MSTEEKNWRKNYYPFSWMYKVLSFLIFFVVICVSCQTFFKKAIPDDLSVYKKGAFSGSVTVHQKKKKHYFSGDVFISKTGVLRMDLSVSPIVPVFTMLLDRSDITFLFLKTKKFYKSHNIDNIPESLFPKGWDLFTFKTVFFDRRPADKKWICKMDKNNLPQKCTNQDWIIQWKRKNKREVLFKKSDFYFTFQYFSFSPEVDEQLFFIKVPKEFKRVFFIK